MTLLIKLYGKKGVSNDRKQYKYNERQTDEREVFRDGKPESICLSRVPARFKSIEGYIKEFEEAGYEVAEHRLTGYKGIFYLRKQ